jgi:hypothetical protein
LVEKRVKLLAWAGDTVLTQSIAKLRRDSHDRLLIHPTHMLGAMNGGRLLKE